MEREGLLPTLKALAARGSPYQGVLYAGLMIAPDGAPAVVEFNCRLGDPEAQVVLPAVDGDFAGECWGWRRASRGGRPSGGCRPSGRR